MLGPSSKAAAKQLARQAARQARAPKHYAALSSHRAGPPTMPIGASRTHALAIDDEGGSVPESSQPAGSLATVVPADGRSAEVDRALAASSTTTTAAAAGQGSKLAVVPSTTASSSLAIEPLSYPDNDALSYNRQAYRPASRRLTPGASPATQEPLVAPLAFLPVDSSTVHRPAVPTAPALPAIRQRIVKPLPPPAPQARDGLTSAQRRAIQKRLRATRPDLDTDERDSWLREHVDALNQLPTAAERDAALSALLDELGTKGSAKRKLAAGRSLPPPTVSTRPSTASTSIAPPPAPVRPVPSSEEAVKVDSPAPPPAPVVSDAHLAAASARATAAAADLGSPDASASLGGPASASAGRSITRTTSPLSPAAPEARDGLSTAQRRKLAERLQAARPGLRDTQYRGWLRKRVTALNKWPTEAERDAAFGALLDELGTKGSAERKPAAGRSLPPPTVSTRPSTASTSIAPPPAPVRPVPSSEEAVKVDLPAPLPAPVVSDAHLAAASARATAAAADLGSPDASASLGGPASASAGRSITRTTSPLSPAAPEARDGLSTAQKTKLAESLQAARPGLSSSQYGKWLRNRVKALNQWPTEAERDAAFGALLDELSSTASNPTVPSPAAGEPMPRHKGTQAEPPAPTSPAASSFVGPIGATAGPLARYQLAAAQSPKPFETAVMRLPRRKETRAEPHAWTPPTAPSPVGPVSAIAGPRVLAPPPSNATADAAPYRSASSPDKAVKVDSPAQPPAPVVSAVHLAAASPSASAAAADLGPSEASTSLGVPASFTRDQCRSLRAAIFASMPELPEETRREMYIRELWDVLRLASSEAREAAFTAVLEHYQSTAVRPPRPAGARFDRHKWIRAELPEQEESATVGSVATQSRPAMPTPAPPAALSLVGPGGAFAKFSLNDSKAGAMPKPAVIRPAAPLAGVAVSGGLALPPAKLTMEVSSSKAAAGDNKAPLARPKAPRAASQAAAGSRRSPAAPPPPATTGADVAPVRPSHRVPIVIAGAPNWLGSTQCNLDAHRAVKIALWVAATGLEPALARSLFVAAEGALAYNDEARQAKIEYDRHQRSLELHARQQLSALERLKEATDGFLSLVVQAEQPRATVFTREHRSEELIDILLPPDAGTSVGTYERSVGPQRVSAHNRFLDGEDDKLDAYDVDRFSLIPHSLDNHGYAALSFERRAKMLSGVLKPRHRFTPTPEVHAALFAFEGLRTSERALIDSLIEDDVESTFGRADRRARGLSFEDLLFGRHHLPRDRSETDVFRPAGRATLSSWKNRLPGYQISATSADDLADDADDIVLASSEEFSLENLEEGKPAAPVTTAPPPPPPMPARAPRAPPAVSASAGSHPLPPHMPSSPVLKAAPPPSEPEPVAQPARSSAAGSSSGPSSVPQVEPAGPPPAAASPAAPTRALEGATTAAAQAPASSLAATDASTLASGETLAAVPTPRPAAPSDLGTKHFLWRWESPKVRQTLGRKAFPSPRRRSSSAASTAASQSTEAVLGHYVHRSTLKMREMVVERHRAHTRLLAWSRDVGAQRAVEARTSGDSSGSSGSSPAAGWRRLGVPMRNLNKVDVGHELY